jgi:hypothetical protein
MGRVRKPERGRAAVRLRRILLLAAHPGEGRLTQPTAATQAWGREPLFMPHTCRSQYLSGPARLGGELPFLNGLVAAAPAPIPDVRT